jgi:hypothetical protein
VFYPRYWLETLVKHWRFLKLALRYRLIAAKVSRDPAWRQYADAATEGDGSSPSRLIHSVTEPAV